MEIVVTVFGYHLTYLELIGSIFNLFAVLLATKANWGNWVSSVIAQFCFFFLFWNTGLYSNAILQIYFTYVCIISIVYWKRTDKNENKGLRWMSNKKRYIWGGITIIVTFLSYFILKELIPIEKQSENLFLDILVTVLSVVGVNLLSLKYIESWVIWIITDIICVFLFGFTGIYLVMIEYLVITGIAIYGFLNWMKIYKLKTT